MSQTNQPQKSVWDLADEERQKQGKFIRIEAGEKKTVQFVLQPENEKIKLVDATFTDKDGKAKTSKRIQFTVIDPKQPAEQKLLELSLKHSKQLEALLKKNLTLIEIQRQGAGLQTTYTFVPVV